MALCTNPPPNTAPQINNQNTTAAMPAMGTATGGPLVSGTYFMTAITYYETSSTGGTHKDTMVADTTASTLVVDEVNTGTVKPTVAATFTVSGHVLTQTLACPAMATATVEYTFAGSTLTVYEYNSKSVSIWTKQ
jgi:hypothetical protein